jgi:sterol desaturase/sphingolipid hydroxylase (fatty acid hydroxylase superfamily)
MDTYLGHWLESPFQGIGTFVPYLFYTYTWQETVGILVFLNIRGMMRHDSRCIFIIGDHHLLHHRYPKYNYGEPWIDYLCGTMKPIENSPIQKDKTN